MEIAQATLDRIGQPQGEFLEYKPVLPPAATIAQLICAFANTSGGAIVLGVVDDGNQILINGLSDEFYAVEITRKAIDLLSPTPQLNYDYIAHQGARLFVIEVPKSSMEISFRSHVYIRTGVLTRLKQSTPAKALTVPAIEQLSKALAQHRKACTEARAKLLDHYESVLRVLDDLSSLLYPNGSGIPTNIAEGKMLMRVLFSSCADTFETFMSDLLYQIYLARPETLKSAAPVTVKEVLECSDMQDFISWYAKEKLKKLQRGSVKGFIAENKAIKSLGVFDETRIAEIEKILQIRHLYTHQNGIVDDKFRKTFPHIKVNTEYPMTLTEFLSRFEYLAEVVEAVDDAARKDFNLALFS